MKTQWNAKTNVELLGPAALEIMMTAAAGYIRTNNLKVLDYESATLVLKSYCKTWFPRAAQEAREALECGMDQVAEATFRATMALAGIEAAKEFAWPADYQPVN